MPVLQPRKEQVGTVCQPEKVLGQKRAVSDGMVVAVVGTAAAVAAAAAPFKNRDGPYDDDAASRDCCSGGVISCPPTSVASRSPDFSSCGPVFPTGSLIRLQRFDAIA